MSTDFHDALLTRTADGQPRHFFDRFMFNLHPVDAVAPSVITGFGHFPGRDVADGYVIACDGREQRNLRFSTQLSATDGNGAGPLSFDLLEANTAWRLRLGPNPTGVAYDIEWRARTPYWLTDVSVANYGGVLTSFEHLVQSGRYVGTLSIDGTAIDVAGWYGQRDRSRGVRTMSGGQGLHLWFQSQFPDRSVGFLLVEDRRGARLLLEGAVLHEDGRVDDVTDVRHALAFDGLDLASGTVEVTTESGARYEIDADASAGGGFMAGAGYGGGHGRQRGRDHVEHDTYPLDGSVGQRALDSSLTDRCCRYEWAGTTGTGIFEFALTRSAAYHYRPTLR